MPQGGTGMLPGDDGPTSVGKIVAEIDRNTRVTGIFAPSPVDQKGRGSGRANKLAETVSQHQCFWPLPGMERRGVPGHFPGIQVAGLVVQGLDPVENIIGNVCTFRSWAGMREFERSRCRGHGGGNNANWDAAFPNRKSAVLASRQSHQSINRSVRPTSGIATTKILRLFSDATLFSLFLP